MRVYVITDLEGVCGVVEPSDVHSEGGRYAMARKMLTQEVNHACKGAFRGGAESVVVLNGHGADHAYNVDYEALEGPVEHIVGTPWDRYLPGLDESVDLVFQLGAHARSGTPLALLEHTMSSAAWHSFRLNGQEISEMGLIGYCAGHFGASVGLVSGDAAACAEGRELFPGVITVETKTALSRTAGRLKMWPEVMEEIEAAAADAVMRPERFKSYPRLTSCVLEVENARTSGADSVRIVEGVERKGGRLMCYSGTDVFDALRRLY